MNFNIYDKYILETLQSKAKETLTKYKECIKNEYLDINKIIKETPIITNQSATSLIKSKKSFIAGVDFFDTKKADFYLLSNNGITVPISVRDTLDIQDKKKLGVLLFKMGHVDTLELKTKTRKEILENEILCRRYGFKKNESALNMASTLRRLSNLNIESVDNSFYKRKTFQERDLAYIHSYTNSLTKQLATNMNMQEIEDEDTLEILKEKGFESYRKVSKYLESINNILPSLSFDLSQSKLYQAIDSQMLNLAAIPFDEHRLESTPFLKITFNEKKVMNVIRNEPIEFASIVKSGTIRINKPICSVEQYEEFLKIEEFIKKNTQKKIEMNIHNIPTLEEIFDKEFGMRR